MLSQLPANPPFVGYILSPIQESLKSGNQIQIEGSKYVYLAGNAPQSTVAIMASPGRHYVEATWGAWLNRDIAVPLCLTHPAR